MTLGCLVFGKGIMGGVFTSWSDLASNFLGDCFDVAKPFIADGYPGLSPLVRFAAAILYVDCHLSSESTLLLIRYQKEWDADLVARSVMEGSLKFAFMLRGSTADVERNAHEYWNILPRFSAIRRSERARRILAELPDADNPNWAPLRGLMMDDSQILEIRSKYTRQARQALEERWSFAGISRALRNADDRGLALLVHLAHGYGMSSHLLHKDADGVGMVWDRYNRDSERRAAVTMGHSARIVSDICAFSQLRLWSLLRACQQPTDALREIEGRYRVPLFNELEKAGSQFTKTEYGPGYGNQGPDVPDPT